MAKKGSITIKELPEGVVMMSSRSAGFPRALARTAAPASLAFVLVAAACFTPKPATAVDLTGGIAGKFSDLSGTDRDALRVLFKQETGIAAPLPDPTSLASSVTISFRAEAGGPIRTVGPTTLVPLNWTEKKAGEKYLYRDPDGVAAGIKKILFADSYGVGKLLIQAGGSGYGAAPVRGPVDWVEASLTIGTTTYCGQFNGVASSPISNDAKAVVFKSGSAACAGPGPAADLSEKISGGNGPFMGSGTPARLEEAGYVEHEYVASGTAASYAPAGPLSADGRWTFAPDGTAPYRTRILVRYPAKAADFSGTVVVEWLNVSGGVDANPDYASLEEELTRQGHAWVGVSAQLIGVEGGPVLVAAPGAGDLAGKGLKSIDPARYGSLEHPGDGFSFDIFTQVAQALRAGGPTMGGLEPRRVLAAGESQSAIALVTYYNGVQPFTRAFDGFLIHSRASFGLPLVGPGEYADLAGGLGSAPVLLRTDLDAPVLVLQAESDVTGILNSAAARQPDSATLRLWEVAGTAHADAHLLGSIADTVDCGKPINDGPLHLVAKAALRGLDEWVRSGGAPPDAPRLELTSGNPAQVRRDADGIALGGIRTPPVDVPVAVLSGVPGPNPTLLCILLGSTTPLPAERLAELYPSRADYVQRYEAAADEVIGAGFVLEDDRDALRAFADPSAVAR